jgi:TRAP-type C4-dicarboxylate transport system substrate-binding protein
MRNWKWISLILCLILASFFDFNSPAFSQAKPIELNYSTHMPGPHSVAILAKEWAKEIEKRTNGRVKITVFVGGTLLPADKCYDGVLKGIADITSANPCNMRGRFPLSEVIELPLGCKSGMAGTRLVNEWYKKFKPKEFDETQVMYFHTHGPGLIHTKKAVNKLEDLKGMKIRCNAVQVDVVKAIGGVPVAMTAAESYDALKKGVAEASFNPMEALAGFKWGEVLKFTIENTGCEFVSIFAVVMNKSKWNAISPGDQKIIEKVNEEWVEKEGKNWDAIDQKGRDFCLNLGNKIISFSQEERAKVQKAVKPLLDEYVKKMEAMGLPGEEALNFCIDRLQKLQ